MKPATLTKADCVERARNLSSQAIAWDACGKRKWAKDARKKRDFYMKVARLFA